MSYVLLILNTRNCNETCKNRNFVIIFCLLKCRTIVKLRYFSTGLARAMSARQSGKCPREASTGHDGRGAGLVCPDALHSRQYVWQCQEREANVQLTPQPHASVVLASQGCGQQVRDVVSKSGLWSASQGCGQLARAVVSKSGMWSASQGCGQ